MKTHHIILTLIIGTILICAGYHAGSQRISEPQTRYLNEWYMLDKGSLRIYREGYIFLPQYARDSVRLDAINKMKQ